MQTVDVCPRCGELGWPLGRFVRRLGLHRCPAVSRSRRDTYTAALTRKALADAEYAELLVAEKRGEVTAGRAEDLSDLTRPSIFGATSLAVAATRALDERYGPLAQWRGITSIDPVTGHASLSLMAKHGEVHRFRLSRQELVHLADACLSAVSADTRRRHEQSFDAKADAPPSLRCEGVRT